jgi:hypothetical protein
MAAMTALTARQINNFAAKLLRTSPANPDLCHLLREVLGDPFAPVAFHPAWRTSDVVAVACGVYEAGDFSALPTLADALQDAGCDDTGVLEHCRGPGPHVRGCSAVDMLLGNE